MAAAWKLLVIFLGENNQFAIATSIKDVAGQPDIYLRAKGYDISGILVDGFNVFSVYDEVKKAARRARDGNGPSLIEARSMRLLGHFVADDQWYRDLKAVEPYWDLEPLRQIRAYFIDNKLADDGELKLSEEKAIREVEEAIDYAEKECTEPPLDTVYQDVYADGEIIK